MLLFIQTDKDVPHQAKNTDRLLNKLKSAYCNITANEWYRSFISCSNVEIFFM